MNTEHFNNLTETQAEAITILMEECAEVIQICAKIQRHGLDSFHPSDPDKKPNTSLLEDELGHVQFATVRAINHLGLTEQNIGRSAVDKSIRIEKFLHHP